MDNLVNSAAQFMVSIGVRMGQKYFVVVVLVREFKS